MKFSNQNYKGILGGPSAYKCAKHSPHALVKNFPRTRSRASIFNESVEQKN